MTLQLNSLSEVSRISDAELVWRLQRLVKVDRVLSAKLLVHLGEVDARGLYREHDARPGSARSCHSCV
jgi:hypothetical protein